MIWSLILLTASLQGFLVPGSDALKIFRTDCFGPQENCNESFSDAYPELSRTRKNKVADTFFFLYTRKNPKMPEQLHKCGGRLPPNSNFDPKKRLIVIVLPFLSNACDVKVFKEWRIKILHKEDCNVLVIDYDWGGIDYTKAVEITKLVAKQSVIVLNLIQESTGIKSSDIIAVGMSLGCQVAGLIGQDFELERIIGVDPAGPYFIGVENENKLDMSDAKLVEIWHCNSGSTFPPWLATDEDIGHLNYYINGGKFQKSCLKESSKYVLKGDLMYGLDTFTSAHSCSHIHCTQFFLHAIDVKGCQIVGIKCSSYEEFRAGNCSSCGPNGENCMTMGFDTDKIIKEIPKEPQIYYLDTPDKPPYCDNSKINLEGFEPTYNSILFEEEEKPKGIFSFFSNFI